MFSSLLFLGFSSTTLGQMVETIGGSKTGMAKTAGYVTENSYIEVRTRKEKRKIFFIILFHYNKREITKYCSDFQSLMILATTLLKM